MKPGDQLWCRFDTGGKVRVTLDDRVLPDRTCGQSDYGWWVSNSYHDYFLSDQGILYREAERTTEQGFHIACGYCPTLIRADKLMEQRQEASYFYAGKKFDRDESRGMPDGC